MGCFNSARVCSDDEHDGAFLILKTGWFCHMKLIFQVADIHSAKSFIL